MTNTAPKKAISVYDRLAYRGPEIDEDGIRIERFTLDGSSWEELRLRLDGRGCRPGDYYRLSKDGRLWMSDTTAERIDHLDAVRAADQYPGGRGLVNGLGMGCIAAAMLDSLDHVDIVEIDGRIVKNVGGWLTETYGERVTIHHADAYTITWPKGTTWDVAWHDIWESASEDILPLMAKLKRRYGRKVAWQGAWAQDEIIRRRESERRRGWWR